MVMLKSYKSLRNSGLVELKIALVLIGFTLASICLGGNVIGVKAENELVTRAANLAETDHIALLELAVENYKKNVHDYTGQLHKQERNGRKLGKKQVIAFKFMEKPYSVFLEWEKNATDADRLLYVEGSNDGKMIVHPTGFFSWLKRVKLHPHDKKALRSGSQPCDRFGFHRMMTEMLRVYELAKKQGHLQMTSLGWTIVDRRKCLKLERRLPDREEYGCVRLVVEMDVEYLVPVSVECYDAKDNLFGRYIYKNLRFNEDLTAEQFLPEANNL